MSFYFLKLCNRKKFGKKIRKKSAKNLQKTCKKLQKNLQKTVWKVRKENLQKTTKKCITKSATKICKKNYKKVCNGNLQKIYKKSATKICKQICKKWNYTGPKRVTFEFPFEWYLTWLVSIMFTYFHVLTSDDLMWPRMATKISPLNSPFNFISNDRWHVIFNQFLHFTGWPVGHVTQAYLGCPIS